MESGRTKVIFDIRSELGRTILLAVLLAIGTNILSSALMGGYNGINSAQAAIGVTMVVLPILVLLISFLPKLTGKFRMEAVITLSNDREKRPLKVERYHFSEAFCTSINGLIAENKAYKNIWEIPFFEEKNGGRVFEISQSGMLASEALEYYVLEELSTHLTDYFGKNKSSDDNVVTLYRNDVPDVFIHNRFVDLFSRPMEEREAFNEGLGERGGRNVVAAFGKGGVLFSRFDLTLPKGARVDRIGHGVIKIKTKRFEMRVKSIFSPFHAVLPREFEDLYMGSSMMKVESRKAIVEIDVKFNPVYFLTPMGWRYYRWIDSFIDKLGDRICFDRFTSKIEWQAALTVRKILNAKERDGLRGSPKASPNTKHPAGHA